MTAALTLGPVLFNWQPEIWRDFYFRMADEAPVERVYIGEVVCSKRHPLYRQYFPDVLERLQTAGKEVALSTLAEVVSAIDIKLVESVSGMTDYPIEINDMSTLEYLGDRAFYGGPLLNVYNEDSMNFLARKGVTHITLPVELPADAISVMSDQATTHGITLETQIFGRMQLALSARCYHARAHGLRKDTCQFVCDKDPDGMPLYTLEDKPFLTINGIQTMSYPYLNLMRELPDLGQCGISHFRLSPHTADMVAVAQIYRLRLDDAISTDEAEASLSQRVPDIPFANGFYHGKEGMRRIA